MLEHVGHITPSTVWFLNHELFAGAKLQQLLRIKATFCVHDIFQDDLSNLINLTALLKSPPDLIDTFLKAVVRTKSPLSFK